MPPAEDSSYKTCAFIKEGKLRADDCSKNLKALCYLDDLYTTKATVGKYSDSSFSLMAPLLGIAIGVTCFVLIVLIIVGYKKRKREKKAIEQPEENKEDINSEDHFSHGTVFDSTDYGINSEARTPKDSWRWKGVDHVDFKM
ncbi:DgyrCDS11093 [Dimorphilus gyrociliatus]|uniref:DgyrCDS11093 n=1 Tax=Dimorphilus gyrociliatus TaxID=2664684 RepID=A0A7I8W3D2_9ANNE|nr:DgyrCDS11093 [Dimorphilus gyrociliatus]